MIIQEFTGERFIPGQGGAQIAYEHLHRYAFAARWARGMRVLDVATGSGFGAALLARQAAGVWALDIDVPSLRGAADQYARSNILFLQADGARLPFPDASMDLVVAFEVLEHMRDQEGLVRELARVSSGRGLVLVSTPDKASYSDARDYSNPFHVSEFYRDDFLELLCAHFRKVQLFRQKVRAGSLIASDEGQGRPTEILTVPLPDPPGLTVEPMYFLALCSSGDPEQPLIDGSAYLDPTDRLLEEWRDLAQELRGEIDKLGAWGRSLEGEVTRRDGTIAELQRQSEELQRQFEERSRWAVSLQRELENHNRWAISLEGEVADRDATIRRVNKALDDASLHLARIRHSLLYRVLCRLRLLPD